MTDTPAPTPQTPAAAPLWVAVMPGVFVLLWSTGFVGARLGMPHAEPFTFLAYRFTILTVLLGGFSLLVRAPWPKDWRETGHTAVAGLLIHGAYLGGVFWSISHGLPAAFSALIVGVQPLLTAVAAGPYLGEKVTARQWTGFLLGFCAVVLVVADDVNLGSAYFYGILANIVSLLGITIGTLYQKRHGTNMDLRTGSVVQFAATGAAMILLAALFEQGRFEWNGESIFAMVWLVFVLSLGAITLLLILIRRGAASKVASLFYLVPPAVALEAYLLFGETLDTGDMAGMAVAMAAVALVTRQGKSKKDT